MEELDENAEAIQSVLSVPIAHIPGKVSNVHEDIWTSSIAYHNTPLGLWFCHQLRFGSSGDSVSLGSLRHIQTIEELIFVRFASGELLEG